MKRIKAPYSYLLLVIVLILTLLNYQNRPIWSMFFLILSIVGLLFLTYLDRDKFYKK